MRLYLVQHATAVDKARDPERPLSREGIADAERIATFLERAGVCVDRVLHSGKTRAAETAAILAHATCASGAIAVEADIAPNDPVEPLVERVRDWNADAMVVGHMPFLACAVSALLGSAPDSAWLAYIPGSVVVLERADNGGWVMVGMIRPDMLA